MDASFADVGSIKELEPFAVSCCDVVESSVHWFHYAKEGSGVALALDAASLAKRAPLLARIDYLRETQEELIGQLLNRVSAGLASGSAGFQARGISSKLGGILFSMYMRVLAALFKAKSFSEEREWRLLFLQIRKNATLLPDAGDKTDRPTKYRAVHGRVVPYMEIDLTPGMVREIVLGHSSPLGVNDHGLRMLIADADLTAKVSKSRVPVR